MLQSLRRLASVAVAAVTAATALGSGTAGSVVSAAQPGSKAVPPAAAPAYKQRQPDKVLTLVTGDRVRLVGGDSGQPVVEPGAGRSGIGFGMSRAGNDLLVIPDDVQPLVVSGRLDRRLFNVTSLLAAGYGDSKAQSIPLIVTYDGSAGRASVRSSGAVPVRELPSINGSAVRIAKGRAFVDALPVRGSRFGGGVERVWLDGKRRVNLDQSVPQIGAPVAWQAGYTGKGVTVAVLDGGADTTHPDLADRIAEVKNFTPSPDGDAAGHGTHVASTIAGTGAASGGSYRGVAPDASLLIGKVCDDIGFCFDSNIVAAMQWAAVEKQADVINVSLGGQDFPEIDPVEEAVNTLTAQTGSLFVVAAGNNGFAGAGSVTSPGSADAALTVGAVDRQDAIADFSSRGPRVGDGAIKPDITGPGVDIVAARAKDGWVGQPVGEHYARLSGTSMATPHVAGAAALLAQQHPEWKAPELKAALMSSAKSHAGQGVFDQGAGRVDVERAITQPVAVTPGSASFGVALWPHEDDEPVTRQLTYRNHGGTDVTLGLQAVFAGPDGQPAPAGAVRLSASSVVVPAGGSAMVSVTSDTRHNGPNGMYTGRVVATADGISITTPIAGEKQIEQYELTVVHRDLDGMPTSEGGSILFGFEKLEPIFAYDEDGIATLRLPRGKYALNGSIWKDDVSRQVIQPVIDLDRDTTVTVDARQTRPVKITVPHPGAEALSFAIGMDIDTGAGFIRFKRGGAMEQTFTAPVGPAVAPEQATAYVATGWLVRDANGGFRNTPVTYNQFDTKRGSYFHGFTRAVKDSQMAKIVSRHHQQLPGRPARKSVGGIVPGMLERLGFPLGDYDLPSTVTHYVEPGAVRWDFAYHEIVDEGEGDRKTSLWSQPRSYRAGETYADTWGAAAFGPAFPRVGDAIRAGNLVFIDPPLFSDQEGHAGYSRHDTASTKLYRNGELVGESAGFALIVDNLPGDRGEFRLVSSGTRPSYSTLTTRIDAEWTFGSQTASERGAGLPLWAVRYFPAVDNLNVAKRHAVTLLPVKLEAQPDAVVGSPAGVEIEVSGDDGTTWTKATVRRTGEGRYVAVFATPAGGYVSLKAKAADTAGNRTEQTIIRAYALR